MKKQKKKDLSVGTFHGNKFVLQNVERNKIYLRENLGITLIALIISIIILLILAGVSFSALVGDNGILNQATNAVDRTNIAREEEMLSQIVATENADKIQHPEETSSYHIGIDLYDKTLENGDIWNIVVINETQEDYGTGWTFIEKGTELMEYGELNYSWLVNYESGEKIRLEEGTYTRLDYSSSMAVTDGLIFNIDPTILEGVTTEELQNNPSILGENVELKNFNWTEESGLTSTSFNFDGEDDHINILYNDQEKLDALYENGLTFEYYGIVNDGNYILSTGENLGYEPLGGIFQLSVRQYTCFSSF